jgi:hypothetical protein
MAASQRQRITSVCFHFRHATSDPAAKDKAGARFKEVSEAYQVLSNGESHI